MGISSTICSQLQKKMDGHHFRQWLNGDESKGKSVFNPIDGGYSLTVSRFDGRQTLWTDVLKESQSVEIEFLFVFA